MRNTLAGALALSLLVASCGKEDNSADTDRAGEELRKAQAALSEHTKSLSDNQNAIEQNKRNLILEQEKLAKEQRALADRQKLLEQQQAQLGAAQEGLAKARAAYGAAIQERFAKLDASIATLAKRTDARARDALAGLQARRDKLAARLGMMEGTQDANWQAYTEDIDTTFDAMEHDLAEVLE